MKNVKTLLRKVSIAITISEKKTLATQGNKLCRCIPHGASPIIV